LADLRAHGGLGAVEFLSRARKAALLGNFNESDKVIEVHGIGVEL
jgi:hypothetical protein